MTFLSLGIDTAVLTQEKDQLEYEEMGIVSQYNQVTNQLAYYSAQDQKNNTTTDTSSLEAYQQLYDSQKTQIESRLKVINAEIESYQKAQDTNIKSSCKFSVSV